MRDLDVRKALRQELERQHYGDDHTCIVEEMGVWAGSVRVDVAVLNGELHGFEIKSDRDTLARLPAQEYLYSQVFDRVTLVIAEKHVKKAEALVPAWWGTMLAVSDGEVVSLRPGRVASANPQPSPVQTARLLWRDEVLSILERHGKAHGLRSASSEKLSNTLASELPENTLRAEVRETLKRRPRPSGKSIENKSEVTVTSYLHPL